VAQSDIIECGVKYRYRMTVPSFDLESADLSTPLLYGGYTAGLWLFKSSSRPTLGLGKDD
jgi:hypothetical protein